eukprot:scaffold853_cov104-Skeletonema_marinoi.AAC.9
MAICITQRIELQEPSIDTNRKKGVPVGKSSVDSFDTEYNASFKQSYSGHLDMLEEGTGGMTKQIEVRSGKKL